MEVGTRLGPGWRLCHDAKEAVKREKVSVNSCQGILLLSLKFRVISLSLLLAKLGNMSAFLGISRSHSLSPA